jgi:drug/metabolite transporter (DMT)-like permease
MSFRPLLLLARPWHYIVFAGVMFGAGGLITEWLLDEGSNPLTLTAVAFAATSVAALIWARRHPQPTRGGWKVGVTMGMLNAAGPAILFNLGFDNLPASINTLLISLGPIFTAITAHFVSIGDRFTGWKAVGLSMSLVGVALLAGAPNTEGLGQPMLGVALSLAGAAMQGASAVWVKKMAERFSPVSVLAPMMTGAAVLAVVASIVAGHPPVPSALEPLHWAILIGMGSTGVFTFLAVLKANELARASTAALTGYLVPLVGVVGGVVLLGEPFSLLLLAGASLVIAGVVLVGRQPRIEFAVENYPPHSS